MQQRYYDPAIGRFLSVDPVTADGATGANFNRYWYANNNPFRFKDPDGRKCSTADGKDSCTFDEFRDSKRNTVPREKALSSGSRLARALGRDRASRIHRAEAAMTAKYTAAKNLAAKGGDVTIEGNSAVGIPDQKVSASTIVERMETIRVIAADHSKVGSPNAIADVPSNLQRLPSGGPMTFYNDGAASPNLPRTFGHEILHTIYSGIGVANGGWANPGVDHQAAFTKASDAIQ
jgi:uncharacterized protein RhaS with RHS repeats